MRRTDVGASAIVGEDGAVKVVERRRHGEGGEFVGETEARRARPGKRISSSPFLLRTSSANRYRSLRNKKELCEQEVLGRITEEGLASFRDGMVIMRSSLN